MQSRRSPSTLVAATLLAAMFVSAVQAQVKLERKIPVGKRTHVTTQHTDQKLTIGAQEVPTLSDVVETKTYTYTAADADGTRRVTVKDEGMVFTLKVMGNVLAEFDSAKPDAAKVADPAAQPVIDNLKAAMGRTHTRVLDKDGKVTAVEGVDAILAKAPAEARDEIERTYSKEGLEKQAKKQRDRLPDRELKKGDKWSITETENIGAGQTLTFDMFYEYQGAIEKDGRTLDKISIYAATVKYEQKADPNVQVKITGSDLKIETPAGTMYFDREKGEIVEVISSVRITGPMMFSINNMELPGKLDLTLESHATIK